MFFAIFAVKEFDYSQRADKKILTAKLAKASRKERKDMNQSNRKAANYGRT
jgi:hypothetical protein